MVDALSHGPLNHIPTSANQSETEHLFLVVVSHSTSKASPPSPNPSASVHVRPPINQRPALSHTYTRTKITPWPAPSKRRQNWLFLDAPGLCLPSSLSLFSRRAGEKRVTLKADSCCVLDLDKGRGTSRDCPAGGCFRFVKERLRPQRRPNWLFTNRSFLMSSCTKGPGASVLAELSCVVSI